MQKIIYISVTGRATDPDDADVAGLYELQIGPADGLTPDLMAGLALDTFHDNIAIAMLEDFEITVLDDAGHVLMEPEDYLPGDAKVLTGFKGCLDPSGAPAAVRHALRR